MLVIQLGILIAFLSQSYIVSLVRGGNNGIFTMNQRQLYERSGKEDNDYCGTMVENYRFDCYPEGVTTQTECEARGCCWGPVPHDLKDGQTAPTAGQSAPWCYFPTNYQDYEVTQYIKTPTGEQLTLTRHTKTAWPQDVMELQVDIAMETEGMYHVKIFDPKTQRYEVPIEKIPVPTSRPMGAYGIDITSKPFGLSVGFGGSMFFDTNLIGAPLIFSDQFIQISTRLPMGPIYGLGEHMDRLLINASAGWQRKVFWAKDIQPESGANLYGTHPFYMGMMPSGMCYGVFFLNSNAMEVDLQPMPALTFRTIGGILDIYMFTGGTPDQVIQRYTSLIGRPYLPPYWSLGFHLCRYGYENSTRLKEIIARNRAIGLPYEVQWTDIDYMDKFKDWTFDPVNFQGLPAIVDDLHAHGQKYVIIVDPGISVTPGYPPYDEGMKADIFIKNSTGQPIIGSVWPGETVFPDFFHPKTPDWWYSHAKAFHDKLPFDGLWTDMNEPSSSGYGSRYGCTDNNLDKPPYTPAVVGRGLPDGTLCPSAKQYLSSHYNLHSLYGYSEVKVTNGVLERLREQRSLVISRSSYPGTGYHGGHWSGDIVSTWDYLKYSIPEMLRFQMFGIPLVGADICGFNGDTTEELCTRWMQLGAFYPFMRNHNSLHQKDQDPGAFSPTAQAAMKHALELRYTFLPYLYTLFYKSRLEGSTVARPLSFVYPRNPETFGIDEQFFWGDGLLISPVLTQGATTVKAYFNASDSYYNVLDGAPVVNSGWQTLSAPLNTINVHVRGGVIIPTQVPDVTTVKSRLNPFGLLVALTQSTSASQLAHAEGELIWDDGESLNSVDNKTYTQILFKALENSLTSNIVMGGYDDPQNMMLGSISLMGLSKAPSVITVNGQKATFDVFTYFVRVNLKDQPVSLMEQPLNVVWD